MSSVGGGKAAGRFAYAAYDFAGSLLSLCGLPLLPLLRHTRHGNDLVQRLGEIPADALRLQRPIWIHAASVGEVLAAEPLLRELRQRFPEVPLLVSTTSLTGRNAARTRLGADAAMLLPVDIRWIVKGVIRRIRPRALVIVETELWPALLRCAAESGVPVTLVSGRISTRSFGQYRRVRSLMRPMLEHISAFLMQTGDDAERICELGAPQHRVRIVGSLKFARDAGVLDTARPSQSIAAAAALLGQRPVLIAASTQNGEEAFVLDAAGRVWSAHPPALLVLAPRRPERFDEIADLLRSRGVRFTRRTQQPERLAGDTQVLLLDTVGELLDFMPAARAVFVGGTIAAQVGGHNVLEPAIFALPAQFGPHTSNVAGAAAALLDAGAATLVHTPADLGGEWLRLLADPESARAMGKRGLAVVAQQADVARRSADFICATLPEEAAQGFTRASPRAAIG